MVADVSGRVALTIADMVSKRDAFWRLLDGDSEAGRADCEVTGRSRKPQVQGATESRATRTGQGVVTNPTRRKT